MTDDRYSRIARYKGFSATLGRWREQAVAVVGLGGLGSGLVQYLARLGVARLALIDRDVVGYENLGHQLLYTAEDARQGLPKTVAAGRAARAINPEVELTEYAVELTRFNIGELLGGVNLVFDGLDSYFVRMVLNDFAVKSTIPWFYAGVVRGELSAKAVVPGRTACLQCLMPELPGPGEVATCAAEGVFPPLLGVANAIQLDLANSWLSGADPADELLSIELPGWELRRVPTGGLKGSCPACSRGGFTYLDGSRDHLAGATCHGGRFSLQLPGAKLRLDEIADRLAGFRKFEITANSFCLSARDGAVRYTLFPDGRLLGEGMGSQQDLNRFAAEYLGL